MYCSCSNLCVIAASMHIVLCVVCQELNRVVILISYWVILTTPLSPKRGHHTSGVWCSRWRLLGLSVTLFLWERASSWSAIYVVSFPDPPVLRAKEGLVYKVGILGCADSAVVGKLRNKT